MILPIRPMRLNPPCSILTLALPTVPLNYPTLHTTRPTYIPTRGTLRPEPQILPQPPLVRQPPIRRPLFRHHLPFSGLRDDNWGFLIRRHSSPDHSDAIKRLCTLSRGAFDAIHGFPGDFKDAVGGGIAVVFGTAAFEEGVEPDVCD